MKTVILAEKPDQGKKYANALGIAKKENGYFKVDSNILDGEVCVTWGIGHLVGLAPMKKYGEQYEKWNMNNLPFNPEKMLYEVTSKTRPQFNIVKKQLESADKIIIATDPDREGEHIAYSIFSQCSSKVKNTPKKRLWINSMVEKEIKRGFENLKDSKDTYNYHREAQTRQISDYLVGMNFTQYFTLLVQSKGLKGVYSLGRVQTPCNSIVVENDNAIRNFKEEAFYKIYGKVSKENKTVKFTNEKKYKNREEITEKMKYHGLDNIVNTKIKSVNKETKETKAPKLFNLGGIQSYANKKWKYSLDQSLKIIQSLYQDGYLSYPRTDCDLITTNEFEYLKMNLERYKNIINIEFDNVNMTARKEYVDNSKVLEHYAIIPTENIPRLDLLSEAQKNIYNAVVKNTILMFANNYVYESTIVTVDVNGMEFTAKGNVAKELGWRSLEKQEEKGEKTNILPPFTEGESIRLSPYIEAGKTTPPVRLTEATMGGKGGIMDRLGLGTPATRSSIIKTLIDREYIKVDKTKLYPTEKGILLYDLTKEILLGRPEMTAKWEEYLLKIGSGTGTQEIFINKINIFINDSLSKLKEEGISEEKVMQVKNSNQKIYGTYIVEELPKLYKCTDKLNNKSTIAIYKTIGGKKITESNVKQLLIKGKTSLIKGFISKKGKKFSAYLVLEKGNVTYDFPEK